MRLPARPTIYEINTAVWLGGRPLGEVPGAQWDALAALPVDAVWLMGVWERSPAGRAITLAEEEVMAGNRAALPDLREEDVIGSPYCVHDYVVDARFGGRAGLAAARAALAERGVGLLLDYVPNHVAPDHPWLAAHPDAFIRTPDGRVANGRDPYFPPWTDVLQLNAFAPVLRGLVGDTLLDLAAQCDGLRCDMAMLMGNEVFARTWGELAGPVPAEEFWPPLIARVKQEHPGFLFLAEVYWDMEWELQQQGFDLCYDKRLYDRLVHEGAEAVRGHLRADLAYQERLLRFIENHDEPRAAAAFGAAQARAAAVAALTLPGARLVHDGQLDGRRVRIPVFLDRGPEEPADADLHAFYARLLRAVADSGLREGAWALCETSGWADNDTHRQLVAWCWTGPAGRAVVVVNLSAAPAQGRVHLPWQDLAGGTWTFEDRLAGARFNRGGDELARDGLFVDLPAWGAHFLT